MQINSVFHNYDISSNCFEKGNLSCYFSAALYVRRNFLAICNKFWRVCFRVQNENDRRVIQLCRGIKRISLPSRPWNKTRKIVGPEIPSDLLPNGSQRRHETAQRRSVIQLYGQEVIRRERARELPNRTLICYLRRVNQWRVTMRGRGVSLEFSSLIS